VKCASLLSFSVLRTPSPPLPPCLVSPLSFVPPNKSDNTALFAIAEMNVERTSSAAYDDFVPIVAFAFVTAIVIIAYVII
jgi:hypothetical protein